MPHKKTPFIIIPTTDYRITSVVINIGGAREKCEHVQDMHHPIFYGKHELWT